MARAPTGITRRPPNKSEVKERRRQQELAWIDWLGQMTKKSDSALAVLGHQSPNTLTRFRDRDGALLDSLTIQMLCEATGLPGPDTYLLAGTPGFAEEAEPYVARKVAEPAEFQIIEIMLKGRPNAASWKLRTRALISAGYFPGDVVITDNSVPTRAGDAVVAQQYDTQTGAAQTIFRLFEPPYLVAPVSDEHLAREPGLQRTLLIDNRNVIVMGPIVHSFRGRRA